MVDKRGTEKGAIGRTSEKTDTTRELELQLEMKKIEIEAEKEKKRMELDDARELRELEKLKMDDARAQREHEWRLAQSNRPDGNRQNEGSGLEGMGEETEEELGAGRLGGSGRRSRVDILADKIKRYVMALRQVVSPMPLDASEIPQLSRVWRQSFARLKYLKPCMRNCCCHFCRIGNKSSVIAEMGDRSHNRHGEGCYAPLGRKERSVWSSALEYPFGLFLSLRHLQYACTKLLLDTNYNQVNSALELSGKHSKLWEIYTLISPL